MRHKNRCKHKRHFKLLLFTIYLHFVASNQISTYAEYHFSSHKQYLFSLLNSKNKKRLKQTKVYQTLFYFVWKETTHRPLKVGAAKTLFSNVHFNDTTWFDECFSFYVITGRQYLSWKSIVTVRFLNHHVIAFFEASVLQVLILWVISAITVRCWYQSSKIKLIMLLNFPDFTFVAVPHFPLQMTFSFTDDFFLYKWHFSLQTQNFFGSMFFTRDFIFSTDHMNKVRTKLRSTWLIIQYKCY